MVYSGTIGNLEIMVHIFLGTWVPRIFSDIGNDGYRQSAQHQNHSDQNQAHAVVLNRVAVYSAAPDL